MKLNKSRVKSHMRSIVSSHLDDCGEVNHTSLVEETADALGFKHVGGPLEEPEHDVWLWAVEVAEEEA